MYRNVASELIRCQGHQAPLPANKEGLQETAAVLVLTEGLQETAVVLVLTEGRDEN